MSDIDQLIATLKTHGQSITTARRVVFEALHGEEPLTIQQLVRRCVAVDRASVYRVITLFEALGIVQRLQTGLKYRLELTDAFHAHHHHATCLRCGQTIPLSEDPSLEKQLQRMAHNVGFQPLHHQLELQGYCQECQAKPAKT